MCLLLTLCYSSQNAPLEEVIPEEVIPEAVNPVSTSEESPPEDDIVDDDDDYDSVCNWHALLMKRVS